MDPELCDSRDSRVYFSFTHQGQHGSGVRERCCVYLELSDEFAEDAVDELADDVGRQTRQQLALVLRRRRQLTRIRLRSTTRTSLLPPSEQR